MASLRTGWARVRTDLPAPTTAHKVNLGAVRLVTPNTPHKVNVGYVQLGVTNSHPALRVGMVRVGTPVSGFVYYVRRGGQWRPVRLYRRVSGTWRPISPSGA